MSGQGQWDKWKLKQFLGLDVHHAVLGIIGLGRIGQVVARRAMGFEMEVLYHDVRRAAPEIESACRAAYVTKEELFRRADIVTIHIPYSRETHHAIGAPEIALMKKSAILIHAARGGVLDDAALVEALRKRRHRRRRSRCLRRGTGDSSGIPGTEECGPVAPYRQFFRKNPFQDGDEGRGESRRRPLFRKSPEPSESGVKGK